MLVVKVETIKMFYDCSRSKQKNILNCFEIQLTWKICKSVPSLRILRGALNSLKADPSILTKYVKRKTINIHYILYVYILNINFIYISIINYIYMYVHIYTKYMFHHKWTILFISQTKGDLPNKYNIKLNSLKWTLL